MAQLCALVANALRGKGRRAYRPADFMPFVPGAGPRVIRDPDETWRYLCSLGRRF